MSLSKKLVPLFLALVLFIGLSSVTYAYAYFDLKSTTQNETVPIGNFDNPFSYITYYTGFETYNETDTGTNTTRNVVIAGVNWQISRVMTGNTTDDLKIGTTSARFLQDSWMDSLDTFKDLKTISFYMGKTVSSPSSGRTYSIQIKDATSAWYTIATGAMPNTFTYFEYDVATIIQNGITLSNNVTVTSTTPLHVRIYFNGRAGNNNVRQNMNLDELNIVYKP